VRAFAHARLDVVEILGHASSLSAAQGWGNESGAASETRPALSVSGGQ